MGGGGMGMISGIVGGALHQPARLPLIVPVWLLVTYATARTTYHSTAQRRARELELLADRIAALAGELIGEQG